MFHAWNMQSFKMFFHGQSPVRWACARCAHGMRGFAPFAGTKI
jgi:hypothetical protein